MQDITPIEIDLNKLKNNQLDESWLLMFGFWVKKLLKAVFGDVSLPVNLKGNPADVRSFLTTLSAEKGHIESIRNHGLNNPQTYKSKSMLDSSISKFERDTGLKWPFK